MIRPDLQARPAAPEALEARFARAIAVRLSEHAEHVAPDIAERLRFSRQKALDKAREQRGLDQPVGVGHAGGGSAVAGFARSQWWWRLSSALPLAALVAGLLLIQDLQTRSQISTAAEVDAALLGDDLPIDAYKDAGFVEFLKATPGE